MFYNGYTRPKTIPHIKTNRYVTEYQEFYDKEGKPYLKEIGKYNLYDKIQEARAGVELNELINKYKFNINDYDLTKIEEIGLNDYTELPQDMMELQNYIIETRSIFEKAPRKIREKFNNNFNEFLQGANNGTLQSYIKELKGTKKQINNNITQYDNKENTILKETEKKGVDLNV